MRGFLTFFSLFLERRMIHYTNHPPESAEKINLILICMHAHFRAGDSGRTRLEFFVPLHFIFGK